MSEVTTVVNTGSQLFANYDKTKIFLGGNRYKKGSIKNTTESEVTIKAGTLLGRVNAIAVDTANVVGYLRTHLSTNTEGGANAIGILAQDVTLAAGATATNVSYCIAGDYDESKLVLGGSDTVNTLISGVAIKDQIIANTQLIGVTVDQLSAYDNQ